MVVGGGGHARVVISILRKLKYDAILGYTDVEDHGVVLGVSYLGTDSEFALTSTRQKKLNAVLALGQVALGNLRYELWKRLQSSSWSFPLIVSPDAIVNDGVLGGEGAVVMDGAVINAVATIGASIGTNGGANGNHAGAEAASSCRVVVAYSNGAARVEIPLPDAWRVRGEDRLIDDLRSQSTVSSAEFAYA